MLLRLSDRLASKVAIAELADSPIETNPCSDWSCRIFIANRAQYVLISNTLSLYSCVISCQGIRDRDSFVGNIVDAIGETMKAAEMQRAYDRLVAPPNGGVTFAKPLHRSVAVAMSDHVYAAKLYLSDGLAAPQIGFRLNHSRHPGLIDRQGRSSAKPWEVFAGLVDESDPSAPCSARSQ